MKYCEEYAALLDAFVDGECSPEEDRRVRAHLNACPGCQNYVNMALAMREAFSDAGDVEVPEDFAAGVMAAIRSGAAPRVRKKVPWKRALISLAACCAIAVLLRFVPFGGLSSSTASLSGDAETRMAGSSSSSSSTPAESRLFSGAASDTAGSSAEESAPAAGSGSSGAAGSSNSGSTGSPRQSTKKKSSDTQEKSSSQSAQTPGTAIQTAPTVQTPTSSESAASGGGNSPAGAGSGSAGSSSGAVSGQEVPPEGISNSLTALPEGTQTAKTTYHKWAAFTRDEVGSALDGYEGTSSYDDSTETTTTTYELEEAEFDAIIAQLNAAGRVTVDDTVTAALCCISVSS